jgi:two-component system, OmpR family, sensor histidine kinase BaeS
VKLVPAAAVVVGLALLVSELAMRPSAPDRLVLYGLFAALSVVAALAGLWLTVAHRRLPSLRWTILVVASAAVVVAGAVVGASALAMFLSVHDLRLVLAALAFGVGLGVLLAAAVAGPLTSDLRELALTAQRVAEGDLGVRTGIDRADEVGRLARSLDAMVARLAHLQAQRDRGDASRRELLASISHDLRTPLGTLQAAIEALEDGVAEDPDRYLRSMASDVELLRGMVDDLFVLARLEAGELRLDRMPVDLAEVADSAVESMAAVAARKNVTVRLESGGLPDVLGDPQALARVLRNLVDNAIRHAPADSTVQVHLEGAGDAAVVRVLDDGPGFPEPFRAHAFDPFSRADAARERSSGGAGLGLAIARGLVEAHAGSIWIEPGSGGRVGVQLPARRVHGGGQRSG